MKVRTIIPFCMLTLALPCSHSKAAELPSKYSQISELVRAPDGRSDRTLVTRKTTSSQTTMSKLLTSCSSSGGLSSQKDVATKFHKTGQTECFRAYTAPVNFKKNNTFIHIRAPRLIHQCNDPSLFRSLSNLHQNMLNDHNAAAEITLAALQKPPHPTPTEVERAGTRFLSFMVDNITTLITKDKYEQEKSGEDKSTITWQIQNPELIEKLAMLYATTQK